MPRDRIPMLLPTILLVLAGLSCEYLDQIQEDPSFVQNPNTPVGQGPAPDVEATFQAEVNATGTALVREHDATRTAEVGTEKAQTATAATASPTPSATPTATPTPIPNLPPVISRFVANFIPADRTTYYNVVATDPEGTPLTYRWSNTNPCGTFDAGVIDFLDPDAAWFHPHPPCPDERFHPAIIKVIVKDEKGGEAVFEYSGGSASGLVDLTTPVPD